MAKPIKTVIKLNLKAGAANPAPPVGTMLGPHGINIQQFCTQYNEQTKDKMGDMVPAEVTIFEDRTFEFKLKTPPASELIKKAAKLEKGSAVPHKEKVGTITSAHLREIAEKKKADLNAYDTEHAAKIIAGTARSMGVVIKD
ncbi:MAG: 50S ribosomal protein L11 [Patescibacteria group bacterium]